jgi:hypothetical protein
MSNNTIFYTQIASIIAFITSLFVLYRLLVEQKDATIQLLKEKTQWLQQQVDSLKESHPDTLLDNLEKRLRLTTEELVRLNQDKESNVLSIQKKEHEVQDLVSQIEDLKSRVDECPICQSPLVILGPGGEDEYKAYECGYSLGNYTNPCPYNPDFPKLDDFELRTEQGRQQNTWFCFPEPKTKMARTLAVGMTTGKTEEEAKERAVKRYEFLARNVPKDK